MKMNILFPGIFNRYHYGHMQIVKTLSKDFDNVVIIPMTYQKKGNLPFNVRFKNLSKQIMSDKNLPNILVSDISNYKEFNNFYRILEYYSEFDYIACGADELHLFKDYSKKLVIFKRNNILIPDYKNIFRIYDFNIDISSTGIDQNIKKLAELGNKSFLKIK